MHFAKIKYYQAIVKKVGSQLCNLNFKNNSGWLGIFADITCLYKKWVWRTNKIFVKKLPINLLGQGNF